MQQIMRMQTDNEFQQVKIKDLNGKYNVAMSMTNACGEKAFAAEQKIREHKRRIFKVKTISDQNKAKISSTTINKRSAENINNFKSEKCKPTPNEIEKKSLENQRFRTEFNFERINISKKSSNRLDRYDRKLHSRTKKKYMTNSMLEKKY